MRLLYSIGIHIAGFILKVLSPFNTKLKLGVEGRKHTFSILKQNITKTDKTIWMHCASLGEFEQGLPVLKALKTAYKNHKIVVSFFSPSGYENKKYIPLADSVVYLPIDTKSNAKQFLDLIHPDLIVFVKYDIWPNFLAEIKRQQLKAILISASFREQQSYFKWYGGLVRQSLFAFEHIFTQNESSKELLGNIQFNNVSVSGDTRFDRVAQQLDIDNSIDFIEEFKNNTDTIIFGSSWPEDDKLFIPFINNCKKDIKFIIAPHKISANYTASLKSQIHKKTITYSEKDKENLANYDVFILDTIGYLSKAYSYADIAYVGGGAGKTGLHNILEPATFGIPILIGENYDKFPEAKILINLKGVTSVTDAEELGLKLKSLIGSKDIRDEQGQINSNYIKQNIGAVIQIMDYIRI